MSSRPFPRRVIFGYLGFGLGENPSLITSGYRERGFDRRNPDCFGRRRIGVKSKEAMRFMAATGPPKLASTEVYPTTMATTVKAIRVVAGKRTASSLTIE